jgi:hypothetical protein
MLHHQPGKFGRFNDNNIRTAIDIGSRKVGRFHSASAAIREGAHRPVSCAMVVSGTVARHRFAFARLHRRPGWNTRRVGRKQNRDQQNN